MNLKIIKHIAGCVSGVGALVAAYFGHLYLLVFLCLVTCFLCWETVPFVMTTIDGLVIRILVFGVSLLIDGLVAGIFDISKSVAMWSVCDIAFLIINLLSLIISFDKSDQY